MLHSSDKVFNVGTKIQGGRSSTAVEDTRLSCAKIILMIVCEARHTDHQILTRIRIENYSICSPHYDFLIGFLGNFVLVVDDFVYGDSSH